MFPVLKNLKFQKIQSHFKILILSVLAHALLIIHIKNAYVHVPKRKQTTLNIE